MIRYEPSFRRPLTAAVALLLSLVAGACNDNPTEIGSEYLPENVTFKTVTLAPGDFTIESGIAAVANSSSDGSLPIVVGRADAGTPDETVAHTLLALTSASTAFQSLSTRPLQSATFRIRAFGYQYGDTSSNIKLELVALNRTFSNKEQWSEALAAEIASAEVLGRVDTPYPDSTFVTFNLDPEPTSRFLSSYFEFDPNNSVLTKKSLAIRSTSEGRQIVSFVGYTSDSRFDTLQPTLTARLSDTTVTIRSGVSNWIAKYDAPIGSGKITLGGGLPIRTLLKFSIDSLPPTATVHKAQLLLHADPSGTRFGSIGPTTYMVGYLGTAGTLVDSSKLANASLVVSASRAALDENSFTDRFEFVALAPVITRWQRYQRGLRGGSDIENWGLVLALNRGSFQTNLESGTVDRITFHDHTAADPALRPSLVITYSMQTDAK